MFKKAGWMLLGIMTVFMVTLAFATKPGPDAVELWEYISAKSPYKEWGNWPDHKGVQRGNMPHGVFHEVFVNNVALESDSAPLPSGSIIVKDNFGKDKELAAVTVMYKVEGYNPGKGNWFWVKYSPSGKVLASGKPKGCVNCHSVRSKNDFVMVHTLRR